MLPAALWLLCLAAVSTTTAQESSSGESSSSSSSTHDTSSESTTGFSFTNALSTLTTDISVPAFTGSEYTYVSPSSQSTVSTLTRTITSGSTTETITTTSTASSNSQITVSSRSVSLTNLVGTTANSTTQNTASSTTSSATATNTVPCNGYPEFCDRKYSNISMVAAHNAAFVIKDNAASNQELSITTQLNDGIRMLTGEVQYVNDTMYNCHTSCDILNAGTWQAELETVLAWLQSNPYDVVTILIVNSDFRPVTDFVAPITNAGLLPYVYRPTYVPQYRDQWPTLSEMILTNQRVVFFMDYDANQTEVPYILDEFTHIWETPFSPTNQSFPCTLQRPPGLNETVARDQYMYLANHNLNVAVDLSSLGIDTGDTEILIPNTAELNLTNGQQDIFGALGAMSLNCTDDWGLPPNFLLVDYYNIGSPEEGSVFYVAAAANNVTYDGKCCGQVSSSAPPTQRACFVGLAFAIIGTIFVVW